MAIQLGREILRTCCAGVVVHLMVVSACSAGGGGEMGDPMAHSPTRLDGAAAAGELDAPSAEQHRPDGGSAVPSLLLPVKEAKANESGSRLKARWYVGADGARQFQSWFDSELESECTFIDLGDGSFRCVPLVSMSSVAHFADPGCSQLLFSLPQRACGERDALFARSPYPNNLGSCSPQFKYFEVGAKVAPAKIYAWSGTACLEQSPDPRRVYWQPGAELPVTSFVAGEIVTE